MDRPWNIDDWKPTVHPESIWGQPHETDVKNAMAQVRQHTNDISERPYWPQHWLDRSRALIILGYLELAVGDAYKAKMLCEAFETPQDSFLVEKVREVAPIKLTGLQKLANMRPGNKDAKVNEMVEEELSKFKLEAYKLLTLSLELSLCLGEALYHCQRGLAWFPNDKSLAKRLEILQQKRKRDQPGGFLAQKYPWMERKHVRRPGKVFAGALAHTEGISEGKCTLKESTLAPSATKKKVRWMDQVFVEPLTAASDNRPGTSKSDTSHPRASLSRSIAIPESDYLGIFAQKNIRSSNRILTDVTVTGVGSLKTQNNCENCYGALGQVRFSRVCCNAEYCRALCREFAITGYHKETCRTIPTTNAAEAQHTGTYDSCHRAYNDVNLDLDLHSRLLLRFLATAKAEGMHPLEHEAAARLTHHYDRRQADRQEMPFSLVSHIMTPLRMLRELGVDIFADTSYDTWVLMALWHRIFIHSHLVHNMRCGSILAINPVFALFNHSCEPNAAWKFDDSTTIKVHAIKDIKENEEIFVSYIDNVHGQSKDERAVLLKDRLGKCKCARCARGE